MHIALSFDSWIVENTLFCNRYHARFTPGACGRQRKQFGDLLCAGCAGLEVQARELPRVEPVVSICETKTEVRSIAPLTRAFTAILQEILDGDEWVDEVQDDPQPQDIFPENAESAEIDPVTKFLLEQLQVLDEEDEPDLEAARVETREPAERVRRVRVYVGRCLKCAGYMVHAAKECHDGTPDDEIYRCWNCGWRTSPAYEFNRKHPGLGW